MKEEMKKAIPFRTASKLPMNKHIQKIGRLLQYKV